MGNYKRKNYIGLITSCHIYVNSPDGPCYRHAATQLERLNKWNTMILHLRPVSGQRISAGATSYVYIDFLGKKYHGMATITELRAKHTISWTLTGECEMRFYWRVVPDGQGTTVSITLAWKENTWMATLSFYRALQRKRAERLLEKILKRFKETVERERVPEDIKASAAA